MVKNNNNKNQPQELQIIVNQSVSATEMLFLYCASALQTRQGTWYHKQSGHEIAPNTVANATKITMLATKIQKLVAKLATN